MSLHHCTTIAPADLPTDEDRAEARRAIWHIREPETDHTFCGKLIRPKNINGRRPDLPGLADTCAVCEQMKRGGRL